MGLAARLVGRKVSSRTMTKFEGKRPIMRLSRLSLPIHHDPSPALRHSMRSPSIKPRSLSVSPPQEYTARHQQGNRVGNSGATLAILCRVLDYFFGRRSRRSGLEFDREGLVVLSRFNEPSAVIPAKTCLGGLRGLQEREEQECKCMPSGILHAFSTDCFLRSTSMTAAGNSKSLASAFNYDCLFLRPMRMVASSFIDKEKLGTKSVTNLSDDFSSTSITSSKRR
jgi:hypothetical protein